MIDLLQEKLQLTTLLESRFLTTNFTEVCADLKPFLFDQRELRFFNQETFLKLLDSAR